MLRIQIIGLAIVSALLMSAVAAGSASAAHVWLINGTPLTSPVKVHSLGLLLLTDNTVTLGPVQVHCHGSATGTVGPNGLDLVEKVTKELLGTNDKIPCTFDKRGPCNSTPAPVALAINLPWHTELYLVGTEVRDMIVSDGAGSPGWTVTCTVGLSQSVDTCTTPLGSTGLANVAGGVNEIFETNSQHANCHLTGETERAGAGEVEGSILTESPSSTEKLMFE